MVLSISSAAFRCAAASMRTPFSVSLSVVLLHDTINGMEIHPLLRSPETFRRTHHLCRSNRAEVAKPQRETETEDRSVRHQYGAYGEKQRAKF